jgi:LDH2 family malate/lactate/ureidoglycolate dehydrogenase
VTETRRYRLDDVRRFATALGAGVGMAPARASTLATHLLWFDAAGAAPFGIATLPGWLDQIETKIVDPHFEGKVTSERTGTAVVDGRGGLPLLVLARAGELAVEKARDAGVGLVRVVNLAPSGPATVVAAEIAIGPAVGLVLGPGPSWSLAFPSEEGFPAIFDATLGANALKKPARGSKHSLASLVGPWASVLATETGWLAAAIAVTAMEPLTTFQERVTAVLKADGNGSGRLDPDDWEARRRDVREHGVAIEPAVWKRLKHWAGRTQIETPEPCDPPRV